MEEELKECPNCGHIPAPYDWCSGSDGWRGQVYCEKCDMRGPAVLGDRQAFVDVWNALPRRLKWTKEKPTEPGWYWWRFEKNIVPHMVYVVHESTMRPVQTDRMLILYPNSKKELDVETRGGEWAGPIPEPEEQ